MTLRDLVLELLQQRGPMTDAQLRQAGGARSHQHVNQVCRRLAEVGILRREPGPDGRILNTLTPGGAIGGDSGPPHRPSTVAATDGNQGPAVVPPLDDPGVLIVIPCSARKRHARVPRATGPTVLDEVPADVSRELAAARDDVRRQASFELDPHLPALERYDGELYRALDAQRLVDARCTVAILSGGYGILDRNEAIGAYDRELQVSDWPNNVLERALVAVVRARGAHTVVGFLAASTQYARIFRRAPWSGLDDVRVMLVSVATGGTTRTTPRALGQALSDALARPLSVKTWRAGSALTLTVTNLQRSRVAPAEHVASAVAALRDDQGACRPDDLRSDDPVWDRPGLYAWWVDEEGMRELGHQLGSQRLLAPIYAGQTGATAWPSGKLTSSTLGQRVRGNHLRGNVRSSTFRRTLASLLASSGDLRESQNGVESGLNRWMRRHLRVKVWPYDDRDRLADLEDRVLEIIDPPLNLRGRGSSELRDLIAARRRDLP